jgi:hypothetical protein
MDSLDVSFGNFYVYDNRECHICIQTLRSQEWDHPTDFEATAELEEDLVCARRDVDVSLRQRRQADWYVIN